MKYILPFVFVLLTGCSVRYELYHSIASIPTTTVDVKSDITVVHDEQYEINGFAISALKDTNYVEGKSIYYLLFSPNKAIILNAERVEDIHLSMSAPIKPTIAKQLINSIKDVLNTNSYTEQKGTLYEFFNTQEHEEIKVSDSVTIYYPSISININKTSKNTMGQIVFQKDRWLTTLFIESETTLINLIKNLELGLQELKNMGYKESNYLSEEKKND